MMFFVLCLFVSVVLSAEVPVYHSQVRNQIGWINLHFPDLDGSHVPRLTHVLWCAAVSEHQDEPRVWVEQNGKAVCGSPHVIQKTLFPAVDSERYLSALGVLDGISIDPKVIGGWDPKHRADIVAVLDLDGEKRGYALRIDTRSRRTQSAVVSTPEVLQPLGLLPRPPHQQSLGAGVITLIALALVACVCVVVVVYRYNEAHPDPFFASKKDTNKSAYVFSKGLAENEAHTMLEKLGKGATPAWHSNKKKSNVEKQAE